MTSLTVPRCRLCGALKVTNSFGAFLCPSCCPAQAINATAPETVPDASAPIPVTPPHPSKREIVATAPYRPGEGGISVINPARLRRGYLRPGEALFVFPLYSTPATVEEED
jgi:hypothetical protein